MVRLYLFSFILLDLIRRFKCLHQSDWTYDHETDMVTLTTNGATYSYAPWDIIGPFAIQQSSPDSDSCVHVHFERGSVKSVVDPSCTPSQFLPSVSELAMMKKKTSCNVPLPTAEETLVIRIEKFYRSSSLDDNPATQEWYDQVLRDLSRMENYCWKNWTKLLLPEKVVIIRELAPIAFRTGSEHWPRLRDNVSYSQIILEEGQKHGWLDKRNLSTTFEDERQVREQLLALELAVLQDTCEHEMHTWYELAKLRANFVRTIVSLNMKVEHFEPVDPQRIAKVRLSMLWNMAKANEVLAHAEYMVRDIAVNTKLVCLSRDDYDAVNIPGPVGVKHHQKNGSSSALRGSFGSVIIFFLAFVKCLR